MTAPGHKAVQRSITLDPQGYQRVLVRLEREGAGTDAPAVTSVPRAPEPSPAARAAPAGGLVAAPASASAGDQPRPVYARPWFWVAVGALAAAGVVGLVLATGGTEYPTGEPRTLPP